MAESDDPESGTNLPPALAAQLGKDEQIRILLQVDRKTLIWPNLRFAMIFGTIAIALFLAVPEDLNMFALCDSYYRTSRCAFWQVAVMPWVVALALGAVICGWAALYHIRERSPIHYALSGSHAFAISTGLRRGGVQRILLSGGEVTPTFFGDGVLLGHRRRGYLVFWGLKDEEKQRVFRCAIAGGAQARPA